MKKSRFRLAVTVAAVLTGAHVAHADAPPPAMFPFVIPWDDAAPGTATDMSFLNAKPAGVHGYVVARNGHFVESKTGKRLRFIGTNFTFDSSFPTHADAEKIAAHLAKLGINIVRIHHHDLYSSPLWDQTVTDRHVFSADGLDRLDYLIAQLKKNGVFVNLNLHVSRQDTPLDGFPESVNHLPENYDKRIDNLDRHMIDLQKRFAKDYLTRVNPYTGLSYAFDPCVAVVEINNENSLVSWAVSDHNTFFEKLPEPFRGEVVAKWNQWLAVRYGTQAALAKAWIPRVTPTATADVLSGATVWNFEEHTGSGTMTKVGDGSTTTAPDIQLTTSVKPDQPWQIQAGLAHLDLAEGALYAVTFRAKADMARDVSVYSGIDTPDWHHTGLDDSASLGTDWKPFRCVFQASHTVAHENRLMFVVGKDVGSVWLRDVRLTPVTTATFLPDGQSLARQNVGIPTDTGSPASNDFVHFLSDTETAYADEMRDYLRHDLHVRANLIDTQMSFGNLASFRREAGSDFADDHAYWQHPSFPGRPWDPDNWFIPNTPQIDALANGETAALGGLAMYRWRGRPFSVSEYNQPFPNDFQAEMFPELATFAAAQDWDMIYAFDYGRYGAGDKNDQVQGFFDTGIDPAKAAFMPAAALIFRGGGYAPSLDPAELILTAAEPPTGQAAGDMWAGTSKTKVNLLTERLSVSVDPKASLPRIARGRTEHIGAPTVTKTPAGVQYAAVGAGSATVIGFVGGRSLAAGPLSATFPPFGNNFAALTLTSTDRLSLAQSKRLLLTITGKAENQDMGWNAARTTYGHRIGHGPVQAEGIPGSFTLANPHIRHVWALDATGSRVREITGVRQTGGTVTFAVGPTDKTVWYELSD